MFRRPKPGESEDEILAMQEAFMAEKQKDKNFQPAVKIINTRKHKTDEETQQESKHPRCDSHIKTKSVKFSHDHTAETSSSSNDTDICDDKVYYPTLIHSVLGNIVEKNVKKPTDDSLKMDVDSAHVAEQSVYVPVCTSLFAQRLKNKRVVVSSMIPSKKILLPNKGTTKNLPDHSILVKGNDALEIHTTNKAILNNMTEDEILQEKDKIMSSMNPDILQYIKSLRKKPVDNPVTEEKIKIEPKVTEMAFHADEYVKNEESPMLTESFLENDVLSHPNLSEWVHFDTLESDKLEWMNNANITESIPEDKTYEARFDFKGYLLPYSLEYNEQNKILFHHGEEPNRPGYTLNELFQLCRSEVTQQRSLALKTIAGILEYNSLGVYNNVIDIPMTKIFFVLRFALDENIPIILEPTLKAMRNMFYHRIEENCLDNLLGLEGGLFQPRLLSTKSEIEETESDVSELKDFHLADLDLICGALRTDILTRIRYILCTVRPSFNCAEYCLQILTRIARDSLENAEKICKTDGLLDFIINEYVPIFIKDKGNPKNNSEYQKIIACALKMLRILVSQSKAIAETLLSKYNLLGAILNYIGNTNAETTFLMRVQIESFYFYSCLLWYEIGFEELQCIVPLLFHSLSTYIKSINLLQTCPNVFYNHVTSLLTLLGIFFDNKAIQNDFDIVNNIENLIFEALVKWCSQVRVIDNYSVIQLNLISALFHCLDSIAKLNITKDAHREAQIKNCILNMMKSDSFMKISSNLSKCSNLISTMKVFKHPKGTNIYQLHVTCPDFSNKLLPTMNNLSPIGFLNALSKYLVQKQDKEMSYCFVSSKYISSYLLCLSSLNSMNLSDSWFTRVELNLLCSIFNLLNNLDLEEDQKDVLYNLSFKLSYILTTTYKQQLEFLLKNIVFNKKWFTTHRLMKNLNIAETSEIINNLETIMECYISTLKLNSSEQSESLVVSNWNQTILPRDWIYMPILGLYTKYHDIDASKSPKSSLNKLSEELMIKNIISCCLKWILVSEIYFPEITNEINLTDRFCRLVCVFLCDNSIFLDSVVKVLLERCMKIIFKIEKASGSLNFNNALIGISNFQDLYSQLVDQFQAVSYGDPVFASCVLVPLSQKHNIKWRKLVWSEYAGCLRFLDCPIEMLCYPLEDYLIPPETDFSLLKCYHRALNSNLLRTNTLTYRIAQQHIDYAKSRQKDKK